MTRDQLEMHRECSFIWAFYDVDLRWSVMCAGSGDVEAYCCWRLDKSLARIRTGNILGGFKLRSCALKFTRKETMIDVESVDHFELRYANYARLSHANWLSTRRLLKLIGSFWFGCMNSQILQMRDTHEIRLLVVNPAPECVQSPL